RAGEKVVGVSGRAIRLGDDQLAKKNGRTMVFVRVLPQLLTGAPAVGDHALAYLIARPVPGFAARLQKNVVFL
ncbi:MAG: hypothetical protein MK133_08140, partial [Planctomycetes bacterium]|nr:hypothetical protein [Planctomycetota bacterium]